MRLQDGPADAAMFFGAVAQLGERGLCKPEVVGSIPISSTDSRFSRRARCRRSERRSEHSSGVESFGTSSFQVFLWCNSPIGSGCIGCGDKSHGRETASFCDN